MKQSIVLGLAAALSVLAVMPAAAETGERCLRLRDVENWRATSNKEVLVVGRHENYKVVLNDGCHAKTVGNFPIFDDRTNFGCFREGDFIRYSRNAGCWIKSIASVEAEEQPSGESN